MYYARMYLCTYIDLGLSIWGCLFGSASVGSLLFFQLYRCNNVFSNFFTPRHMFSCEKAFFIPVFLSLVLNCHQCFCNFAFSSVGVRGLYRPIYSSEKLWSIFVWPLSFDLPCRKRSTRSLHSTYISFSVTQVHIPRISRCDSEH